MYLRNFQTFSKEYNIKFDKISDVRYNNYDYQTAYIKIDDYKRLVFKIYNEPVSITYTGFRYILNVYLEEFERKYYFNSKGKREYKVCDSELTLLTSFTTTDFEYKVNGIWIGTSRPFNYAYGSLKPYRSIQTLSMTNKFGTKITENDLNRIIQNNITQCIIGKV